MISSEKNIDIKKFYVNFEYPKITEIRNTVDNMSIRELFRYFLIKTNCQSLVFLEKNKLWNSL